MGVLASYAVWAYSWNFTIFVIARIIGGLSKGNVTISTAIIADVTSTKNRGKGMVTEKTFTLEFELLLKGPNIVSHTLFLFISESLVTLYAI